MTPKLFKASDVCEIAQLQPYVLRSWEKEFPGIGLQKSPDGPRLYRQSDIEQVHKIKQLVFGEGLTLSGARRRLEHDGAPAAPGASDKEVAEVLDALASNARTRIASVRDGLRSLLSMLSGEPGMVVVVDDYRPQPAKKARRAANGPQARAMAKPAAKRTMRKAARVKRGKRAGA